MMMIRSKSLWLGLIGVLLFTPVGLAFTLEEALTWISEHREELSIVSDRIGVDVGVVADVWLGQLEENPEGEEGGIEWSEGDLGLSDPYANQEAIENYVWQVNEDSEFNLNPDELTEYSDLLVSEGVANQNLSASGQEQILTRTTSVTHASMTVGELAALAQTSTVSQDILKILTLQNQEIGKIMAVNQQENLHQQVTDNLTLKGITQTAKKLQQAGQQRNASTWGSVFTAVEALNTVGPLSN